MLNSTAITLLATLLATFGSVEALPKPNAAPRSATLQGRRTPGQNELYKREGVFNRSFAQEEVSRLQLKYGPKSVAPAKSVLADATALPLSAVNLKAKKSNSRRSSGREALTDVSEYPVCHPLAPE